MAAASRGNYGEVWKMSYIENRDYIACVLAGITESHFKSEPSVARSQSFAFFCCVVLRVIRGEEIVYGSFLQSA